jgi:hypothetical protein
VDEPVLVKVLEAAAGLEDDLELLADGEPLLDLRWRDDVAEQLHRVVGPPEANAAAVDLDDVVVVEAEQVLPLALEAADPALARGDLRGHLRRRERDVVDLQDRAHGAHVERLAAQLAGHGLGLVEAFRVACGLHLGIGIKVSVVEGVQVHIGQVDGRHAALANLLSQGVHAINDARRLGIRSLRGGRFAHGFLRGHLPEPPGLLVRERLLAVLPCVIHRRPLWRMNRALVFPSW